jgi:CAAX prenyl protease-like protein
MSKPAWLRILPFALFMGFIGLQQGMEWAVGQGILPLTAEQLLYLYPLKAILVALLLVAFFRHYRELRCRDFANLKHSFGSLLVGLLVFVLWINMDWEFATIGDNQGFDPTLVAPEVTRNILIFFRIFGATLVVPVMEELFWRSFLLRYLINSDFERVPIGAFSWGSFVIGAGLFGLEHNLLLAGVMAGAAYSLLLYRTRSIAQCVLAHAVTNFALGIYVLQTGNWRFW